MSRDIRKSAIAGTWYPGNARQLRSDIERYFLGVQERVAEGEIVSLIAPHAGYMYSGQVAAYAYNTIRGMVFDTVFVIGPSHRAHFPGVSVYERGGFETPMGIVPVDEEVARLLISQSDTITNLPSAHLHEHSIEIQLPFLQVALGEFAFVPVLMGDQSGEICEILSECILRSIGGRKVLIVGSSDLSHFYTYEKAVARDNIVLEHVRKLDFQTLLRDLEKGKCEACGGGPMVVTMMVSKKIGASKVGLLKYANSGDVTGDRRSVVGYMSAVFLK